MSTYIETDCTITHEGRTFDASGAVVTPEAAIAYVGALVNVNPHGTSMRITNGTRALNDWHGNQIGTCYISRSWRVFSYLGSHMNQIYARINGVDYTGRGFGEGMSVRLRRCAKQSN